MDKKVKKLDQTERNDKLTLTKDRGDLKINLIEKNKSNTYNDKTLKDYVPDGGDSEKKLSINQNRIKLHADKKIANEDVKFRNVEPMVTVAAASTDKDVYVKNYKDKSEVLRTRPDFENRIRIRENYTLRLKSINQIATNLTEQDGVKGGYAKSRDKSGVRSNKQTTENNLRIEKQQESSNEGQSEQTKSDKDSLRTQRKPIIKTVKSKNDTRLYKAVTFVDKKISTPLQIKIPSGIHKKQKYSKATDTYYQKNKIKATVSRISVKENYVNRRRMDKKHKIEYAKKHFTTPDSSVTKNSSPPTEVAKWAPSCINRHTKPYYEAWVNTTLAAVSKSQDDEMLLIEKQKIIDSFKRTLEGPRAPELIYENIADERYTGRIKVTQRT